MRWGLPLARLVPTVALASMLLASGARPAVAAVQTSSAAVGLEASDFDPWTVLSIGATTYLAAQLLHEGLGHAGVCALAGGRVTGVSTSVAGCEGVSGAGLRATQMGGTLVDLGVGVGLLTALALEPPDDGATYYAMWLLGSVSLLQAGGYWMVFPWLPEGDWSTEGALRGADPALPAQLGLSALGLVVTAAAVPIMNTLLEPLIGGGEDRDARRWLLTLGSYGLGSALITGGALLSRTDDALGVVSAAAATFAGTLAIAYLPLFFTDEVFRFGEASAGPARPIERSLPWIVVGAIAAVSAVALLGPGVGRGFPEPHPLGLP
jgi:hypothetical protein